MSRAFSAAAKRLGRSAGACARDSPEASAAPANNPAVASLPFGEWSRVLVGQIHRGHYVFVIDGAKRVQGSAGWGLVTRDKAEAWVECRYNLTYQDCLAGDCIVFNAWVADSTRV